MDRILRVNMTSLTVQVEPLPAKYSLLGGRGLTAAILSDEVKPSCDPLNADNKLIFAVGLLAGSNVSSTNRISVGSKSPLTGVIKESNGGGITALRLAQQQFRAVIIEGQPDDHRYYTLVIDEQNIKLDDAGDLIGLLNGAAAEKLLAKYGRKAGVAFIGPSGEMRLAAAGIVNVDKDGHPGRFCARGGLGAVMGSKGLKALVIAQARQTRLNPQNKELWEKSSADFHKTIKALPVTAQLFPSYGTLSTLEYINEVGGLPTCNFSQGSFELAENISGSVLHDIIVLRGGDGTPTHACMNGCLVRSSNRFADANGKFVVAPLEYENNALLGANLGIGDIDAIADLNRICNELGLDTIETGAALGVAMDAGLLAFGDYESARNLLNEVAQGTVLGRVLGNGAVIMGKVFGAKRVPAVMGQAIPGYDPRAIKANGVTYATSAMGADHTCGNAGVMRNVDQANSKGKVELSRSMQVDCAIIDILGLCLFLRPIFMAEPEVVLNMVVARVGRNLTLADLRQVGYQVLSLERDFNYAAGLPLVSHLPHFIKTESLPPHGFVWDINDDQLAAMWE